MKKFNFIAMFQWIGMMNNNYLSYADLFAVETLYKFSDVNFQFGSNGGGSNDESLRGFSSTSQTWFAQIEDIKVYVTDNNYPYIITIEKDDLKVTNCDLYCLNFHVVEPPPTKTRVVVDFILDGDGKEMREVFICEHNMYQPKEDYAFDIMCYHNAKEIKITNFYIEER